MPSRRERVARYKELRAESHRKNETLNVTLSRVYGFVSAGSYGVDFSGKSKHKDPLLERRRNPGRDDGYAYKSDAYLLAKDTIGMDKYDEDIYYEYDHMGRYLKNEFDDELEGEQPTGADGSLKPIASISLMDLAKPAKPRGLAKSFVVISSVPRVLEVDEVDMDWADSNWECWKNENYDYEAWVNVPDFNRKSYASAVTKG